MKKLLLIILACSPVLATAQNLKKIKAKTSALEYPSVALSEHNIANLSIEFCSGDIEFTGNKMIKEGAMCKAQGSSKLMMLEVFRMNCYTKSTASYFRIKSTAGDVLYMDQWDPTTTTYKFGEEMCYFVEAFCTSAYDKGKADFETASNKKDYDEKYNSTKSSIDRALFFNYVAEDVEVHYPKDKERNYDDLKSAAETAGEGYDALKGKYDDAMGISKLKEAITFWDKALEESDMENKEARINKKVTLSIMENIARAYGYMMDYDKALSVINEELKLEGNFTNNKTEIRKQLRNTLMRRRTAYEKNKNRTVTLKKEKVTLGAAKGDQLASFEKDWKGYSDVPVADYIEQALEEAKPKEGENPLRALITKDATQTMLMLPSLAAGMIGLPEYSKKPTEFFPEICELTELTTLIIRGTMSSVPACIGDLENLKKLQLSNNKLTKLPDEIGKLSNLKNLILKGNPMSAEEVTRIQGLLPDCKVKF